MKSILLPAILASFIAQGSELKTESDIPMPDKCPESAMLASEAIDYVAPYILSGNGSETTWIGVKENADYGTNNTWSTLIFSLNDIGHNGKKAFQKLTSTLESLEAMGNNTPGWEVYRGVWFCVYSNKNKEVFAFTIYPSLYSD